MKTFNVGIREVHARWFEVEAENEEKAKALVKDRAPEATDTEYLEYSHELPSDTWFVEEKPNQNPTH